MSATITATEILLADTRDGREVAVLVETTDTISGFSVTIRDDETGETLLSVDVIDHPAVRQFLTTKDAEIVRQTLSNVFGA